MEILIYFKFLYNYQWNNKNKKCYIIYVYNHYMNITL